MQMRICGGPLAQGVHAAPVAFLELQMEAVLSDIGADVVKTGMLPNAEVRRPP